MKLASIVLENYKGFRTNQIHHFSYQPEQKTQAILGSNGSGKSQLIKRILPLPASPKDFYKPGRLELYYPNIHGHDYRIVQTFAEKNEYHFFEDDVNLNPGLTLTVYKDLVKDKFGLTPEMGPILTGQLKFSQMSVAERRRWFTLINTSDYSYALRYHKRAKEQLSGCKATLQRTKARLVHETEKLLTEEEEAEICAELRRLKHVLGELLEAKRPRLTQQEHAKLQADAQFVKDDSELLARTVPTLLRTLSGFTFEEIEDVRERAKERIATLEPRLYQRTGQTNELMAQAERLAKQRDLASSQSEVSVEQLDAAIRECEEAIARAQTYLHTPFEYRDVNLAQERIGEAVEAYLAILTELEGLPACKFLLTYPQIVEKINKLEGERYQRDMRHSEVRAELRHLQAHKDKGEVHCPKCQHAFVPGFEEAVFAKLERENEALATRLTQIAEELEALYVDRAIHEKHSSLQGMRRTLVQSHQELEPLWGYLPDLTREHVPKIRELLNFAVLDITHLVEIDKQTKQITKLSEMRAVKLNASEIDLAKVNDELEHLRAKIREGTAQEHKLRTELQDARELYNATGGLKTAQERLEVIRATDASVNEQILTDALLAILDGMIRHLREITDKHEHRLSHLASQQAIVLHLKDEVDMLEEELKLLTLAERTLSPTEGLIAKGMTSFINHFVDAMNSWIADVWLYPLEVLPVEIDHETFDLTYRFKVATNHDEEDTSDDVSETSAGQREIIDLAFVIVSMQYIGLEDMPLFLDEFSTTFDLAHRQAAYKLIERLIASENYSQVFIVSHYKDGYANLPEADYVVLCDANIDLPEGTPYNETVTIS